VHTDAALACWPVARRSTSAIGGNTALHLAAQVGDWLVRAPSRKAPIPTCAPEIDGGGWRARGAVDAGAPAGEQTPLMLAARGDHEA
jgi:hypothetical protein